jgi:hypothetical protein
LSSFAGWGRGRSGAESGSEELILPHPAMAERRFVLEPLAEVAPEWVHLMSWGDGARDAGSTGGRSLILDRSQKDLSREIVGPLR